MENKNKEIKYKLTGKDVKTIVESIKMKISEDLNTNKEEIYDIEFDDEKQSDKIDNDNVKNDRFLLLDEDEMDYNKLKIVGKDILKQILSVRSEIVDSKHDDGVIKILKNIEKLAEELLNYEYKNLPSEEKEKEVEQAFENKIV